MYSTFFGECSSLKKRSYLSPWGFKDIYSMSHFYFGLPWLLESCIPVNFICTPFSFWNVTVLWSNTTQIVITHIYVNFSRRTFSLSICSMVQLYIAVQYSREWKYSTNVNCHCQSKTEESKGCQTSNQIATMESFKLL